MKRKEEESLRILRNIEKKGQKRMLILRKMKRKEDESLRILKKNLDKRGRESEDSKKDGEK